MLYYNNNNFYELNKAREEIPRCGVRNGKQNNIQS